MQIYNKEDNGYVVYFVMEKGKPLILASGEISENKDVYRNAEERLRDYLQGNMAVIN